MASPDAVRDFVRLSKALGGNAAYVQGGGGNTSVKDRGNRMLVKASGLTLSEVTESFGFTVVDYAAIRGFVEDPEGDEDLYTASVIESIVERPSRPSLETGFHAILGPVVGHTHSVYANILTCAEKGRDHVYDLFPDAAWVPYSSPGRELTIAISRIPDKNIYFLQNHGIIVTGETCDEVLDRHAALNETIRRAYGMSRDFAVDADRSYDLEFMRNHILFPDQVIYTSEENGLSESVAGRETISAYAFIHRTIEANGMTPNYLQPSDADFLLGMEAEKHRRSVTR